MIESREQYARKIMSGESHGLSSAFLRALLSAIEPIYRGVVSTRNAMFDKGRKTIHKLPRPVVCVGNITTGGTGKTPVVCYLANALREAGQKPAILMRGYRSKDGQSDEAAMLAGILNRPGALDIPVVTNPDRFAGGQKLLTDHPDTSVILLDDGYQHRQLHRDFNLVLINALEPFGFGHVLPRGLLREPLSGLGRANAFLLTYVSEATPESLAEIEIELKRRQPGAPIYHCDHVHTQLAMGSEQFPIERLSTERFYAFAGLGNPEGLHRQISRQGPAYVGHAWFPDHHWYSEKELQSIESEARTRGATMLLTTEKDYSKLAGRNLPIQLPLARLQLGLKFRGDDGSRLVHQLRTTIQNHQK